MQPEAVALARARLEARIKAASGQSGPVVTLHGDYQTSNLFDLGAKVVAFDRQFNRHGLAYLDVARFLSLLAQTRDMAAARGRPWPSDHDADRRLFFSAYGAVDLRHIGLLDLAEDVVIFNRWYACVRLGRGLSELDEQMRVRGLLDDAPCPARPGRLVAEASGAGFWTNEPVAAPRRSRWSGIPATGRTIVRWGRSGLANR